MKFFTVAFCLFTFTMQLMYSQSSGSGDICISTEEEKLSNMINAYRIENAEELIPLSYSLTKVAKLHTSDLERNHPDTSVCNAHSWSDKGYWTPCCYNKYLPEPECMKLKPAELSSYTHAGYELIIWDSEQISAEDAFSLWVSVTESNEFILNQGQWSKMTWNAMGVSLSEQYASVWFGEKADKENPPLLCGTGEAANTDNVDLTGNLPKQQGNVFLREEGKYHIIFGSFQTDAEAIRVLEKYRLEFPSAGIIKGNGKIRLSLSQYASLQEVKKSREKLSDKYSSAWILKY